MAETTQQIHSGAHHVLCHRSCQWTLAEGKSEWLIVEWMQFSERSVLTGLLVFAVGVVVGIGIGSASAVAALTQGAPDVLQSWSGVVALP